MMSRWTDGLSRIGWAVLIAISLTWPAPACRAELSDAVQIVNIRNKFDLKFDQMIERRIIRVLVTYNKTNFSLSAASPIGATYDAFKEFEKTLNQKLRKQKKYKNKNLEVHVIFIPVSRDQLLPLLNEGIGDIAAANLTITPERRALVAFTNPLLSNVKEVVVTGPESEPIESLDDLSGREVFVTESTSYQYSLGKLNNKLVAAGKAPVKIKLTPGHMESEDLLEMVNAGLLPITVVDNHIGGLWARLFKNIKLHPNLALRSGGRIAWAVRKGDPKLLAELNAFIETRKKGTLYGNIIFNRYFKNTKMISNSLSPEDIWRFQEATELFKKYSGQYGFDWLMIAALAYQESRIDQSVRSPAGAIGVMQILPSTAADPIVGIPEIEITDKNIHAGVKYLHHLYNAYFKDLNMDLINRIMFTFASYNAGPNKVMQLRKRAEEMGLDPNIWFRNVEIAAAQVIGRETVKYVSNIYKYYMAYRLISQRMADRRQAVQEIKGKK